MARPAPGSKAGVGRIQGQVASQLVAIERQPCFCPRAVSCPRRDDRRERAQILETSDMLTPESFPAELFEKDSSSTVLSMDTDVSLSEARRKAILRFEKQYLKELMLKNKGKINLSAHEAGISTRQLHKLMIKYGLRKEDFKNRT